MRTDEGSFVRCEHATALVKGEEVRAVIGDFVEVTVPEGHDKGIIESILPRTRSCAKIPPNARSRRCWLRISTLCSWRNRYQT